MKMIHRTYMLPIFLFVCLSYSYAQNKNSAVKELKIGDQCPDFIFTKIINYKTTTAHLSNFKGRIVILDFWATWCGPCLTALPKLDSLQQQYGSKIMILPVTYEEGQDVRTLLKNSVSLHKLHLPSITGDRVLTKYFPHGLIPHEVCIDGNGKVVSITDAENINRRNIDSLLKGKGSSIEVKKDIADADYNNSPLLVGGLGKKYIFDKSTLKFSSILTGCIDGLPSLHGAPNVYGDVAKIVCLNSTIAGLYQTALATKNKPLIAYDDPDFYLRLSQRTVWEASDTILRNRLFDWPGRTSKSWRAVPTSENTFCYELILPKADSTKLNAYAIEDLNRYFGNMFGIVGKVEKRDVQCMALVVTDKQKIPISKGGKSQYNFDGDLKKIVLNNYTINKFLFWWLNYEMGRYPLPVINETDFTLPVDMDINADPKNITEINEGLKKYGLEFKEVKRSLDMIVITDKGH